MAVSMLFEENNFGFTLTLTDEDDNCVSVTLPAEKHWHVPLRPKT